MITLTYPTADSNKYFMYRDFFLGPFDGTGVRSIETETWRHGADSLSESQGAFKENDCSHWKVDGELRAEVFFDSFLPKPTSLYPDRASITGFTYGNSTKGTFESSFGLAVHGEIRNYISYSGTNGSRHVVLYNYEGSILTVFSTDWNRSYPTTCMGWSRRDVLYAPKFEKGKQTTLVERHTYWTNATQGRPGVNIETCPMDVLIHLPDLAVGSKLSSPYVSNVTAVWWICSPSSTAALTFEAMRSEIDIAAAFGWMGFDSPIQPEHYGDLAMVATEGFDAVNINMLSFLRDLRHPQELIPKLKNLRSISSVDLKALGKDASDTYLTLKYGVLPTISDLQSIWEAMTAHRTNTDRNGFKVSSASHHESEAVSSDEEYTLDQYIKLAVATDDSLFLSLLDGMESIGILPNCENIWDLVPYSFVVDWFIDVGDLLERVDTRLRLLRMDIRYVTMSQKVCRIVSYKPGHSFSYTGSLKWVQYHRWVSDQCPVPPLSLQSSILDFDHWLESSALLIQRAK